MLSTDHGDSGIDVPALGGSARLHHELHVPLWNGADVVGVLTLGRLSPRPFDTIDRDQLDYLAGRAGASIANAITLREVSDQAALNRAVLDTAADAFISIDAHSTITAWNPAAERMFGWTARGGGRAIAGRADRAEPVPIRPRARARSRDGRSRAAPRRGSGARGRGLPSRGARVPGGGHHLPARAPRRADLQCIRPRHLPPEARGALRGRSVRRHARALRVRQPRGGQAGGSARHRRIPRLAARRDLGRRRAGRSPSSHGRLGGPRRGGRGGGGADDVLHRAQGGRAGREGLGDRVPGLERGPVGRARVRSPRRPAACRSIGCDRVPGDHGGAAHRGRRVLRARAGAAPRRAAVAGRTRSAARSASSSIASAPRWRPIGSRTSSSRWSPTSCEPP